MAREECYKMGERSVIRDLISAYLFASCNYFTLLVANIASIDPVA